MKIQYVCQKVTERKGLGVALLALLLTLSATVVAPFVTVVSVSATAPELVTVGSVTGLTRPVQERATVVSRVLFAEQDSSSEQGVWLAGLAHEPGGPPTALALTFSKVTSGWLGPLWGLQLQSDAGLLPGRLNPQQGSGFLEGSEFVLLQTLAPRWGHEYEARLGYDPETGAAAFLVVDVTDGRTIFSRNMQLHPAETTLYPAAGVSELAHGERAPTAQPLATVLDLTLEHRLLPVRPSWWIMQRPSPDQPYLTVEQVDRRRETAISLHLPWEQPIGRLGVSLRDAQGQEVLYAPYEHEQEYTLLLTHALPAGRYAAVLEYADGPEVWELERRDVTVGVIEVDLTRLVAGRGEDDTLVVEGALQIAGDGPLGEVAVGLDAAVVHHAFAYDRASGRGTFTQQAGEVERVFGPVVVAIDGESQLEFRAVLDMPGAASATSLWEVRVEPFSAPEGYFEKGARYQTWVGVEPKSDPGIGFLQNEWVSRRELAPGVEVISMTGRMAAGPLQMHLVVADLTEPGVSVDALVGSTLLTPASSRWPRSQVSEMVRASGAVAGVNSAFFDISDTMNPLGIVMRSGELLKLDLGGRTNAIGIDVDGAPYLGYWQWAGGVQRPDGTEYRSLAGLNPTAPGVGLALYRAPATRTVGTTDPNMPVVELILRELPSTEVEASPWGPGNARGLRGVVEEIRQGGGPTPLREGMMILAGAGTNGEYLLDTFAVGDVVEVVYRLTGTTEWPQLEDWQDLYAAVSGGAVLLRNGVYGEGAVTTNRERHPRTAVGISWDQSRLYVLVADGRSSASVGMTYQEMADFFRYVGAFHALNLDGGGSTSLAVKDPTLNFVTVVNTPSDGRERYVPDGLGIFYAPPVE